ncbi:hypothetical protein HETIRDRAFT_166213 [Heterobasidion irregulare TC 32-1]|uniref:Uncharacterized protein n=1 Tax=Heterobasidion irregulare (strain TC 32-1) TaxID=747525 RepID=W4KNR9_HETIT|nr:uncharacterized protein HETIRDRAFT_166213 [Heterobasidion irregulare TC 32-1]ETW86696.1 hypothetical protein HETIRDRAFT_166213 [Heterobasidion irregulare TC 32-1]
MLSTHGRDRTALQHAIPFQLARKHYLSKRYCQARSSALGHDVAIVLIVLGIYVENPMKDIQSPIFARSCQRPSAASVAHTPYYVDASIAAIGDAFINVASMYTHRAGREVNAHQLSHVLNHVLAPHHHGRGHSFKRPFRFNFYAGEAETHWRLRCYFSQTSHAM